MFQLSLEITHANGATTKWLQARSLEDAAVKVSDCLSQFLVDNAYPLIKKVEIKFTLLNFQNAVRSAP